MFRLTNLTRIPTVFNPFSHQDFPKNFIARLASSFPHDIKNIKNDSIDLSDNFSAVPPNMQNEGEQFRYLLRNSNFINMGEAENKIVKGKIFQTVKDDLYVDFGWKFYCVCPRPSKNGHLYVRGSDVLLKIKNLELSTKFLGSEKDLTLLEADASIVKLISSPARSDS